MNELKTIKNGMFTIAVDDSIHERGQKQSYLYCVLCKGTSIENVYRTSIEVDGLDATEKLTALLNKFKPTFNLIVTHGITVGGFNLLDIEKINQDVGIPIVSITENLPNVDDFGKAIQKMPQGDFRMRIVEKAGPMHTCKTKIGKVPIFFYCKGIDPVVASNFINKFSLRSKLPEQLLLAHKIASTIEL